MIRDRKRNEEKYKHQNQPWFNCLNRLYIAFWQRFYLVGNDRKTYPQESNTAINRIHSKTYSSQVMSFSVDVPEKFQINDAVDKLILHRRQ
ncbi:MAG: hypothetical protein AAB600_01610 [Patescibacteria group bacterium]